MLTSNVTVDPLAQASPVDDPELAEVLDLESGDLFKAVDLIAGLRYDALVKLRVDVQEGMSKGRYRYQCAWCSTPAYIVASSKKRFFFRHIEEDGSCAAKTRGMHRDEILARKYFGQREGAAHQRIKGLIERSLLADPAFGAVALEKTWRSARDPKARRQPDVQATHGDQHLAFEVQLSTTFLSVVAGRRSFYRDQGALLVWVMGQFSPDYRRMTTDDLLFSNNSNILVVDEETTRLSEASGVFHVRCHFRKPVRSGGGVIDKWEKKIAGFRELTIDRDQQRAFLFDYEGEERALRLSIQAERAEEERRADEAVRGAFFEFWASRTSESDYQAIRDRWWELSRMFKARGVNIPRAYEDFSRKSTIVDALLSAREGRPIGWKYKSLVEVSHLLEDKYKDCLVPFIYALDVYGHRASWLDGDRSGKWKAKSAAIRQRAIQYDPDYLPDDLWLEPVCYLFPEIKEKLMGYTQRANAFYAQLDDEI